MIHPTYLHPGVARLLLQLSRAKRRVVIMRRRADYWQSNGEGTAYGSVTHSCRRMQLHAMQDAQAIERALGVRK